MTTATELNTFTAATAATMKGWSYDAAASRNGDGEYHDVAYIVRVKDGMKISVSVIAYGAGKGRLQARFAFQQPAWVDSCGTVHGTDSHPKITRKADTNPTALGKAIMGALVVKCEADFARGVTARNRYQAALDCHAVAGTALGLEKDHRGDWSRTWCDTGEPRVKVETGCGGKYDASISGATEDQMRAILDILGKEV